VLPKGGTASFKKRNISSALGARHLRTSVYRRAIFRQAWERERQSQTTLRHGRSRAGAGNTVSEHNAICATVSHRYVEGWVRGGGGAKTTRPRSSTGRGCFFKTGLHPKVMGEWTRAPSNIRKRKNRRLGRKGGGTSVRKGEGRR